MWTTACHLHLFQGIPDDGTECRVYLQEAQCIGTLCVNNFHSSSFCWVLLLSLTAASSKKEHLQGEREGQKSHQVPIRYRISVGSVPAFGHAEPPVAAGIGGFVGQTANRTEH